MITRRAFVRGGSRALVSLGLAPAILSRAAGAVRTRARLLVVIFQRGAADGLNMVVPHAEPAYYRARPSIAIARPGARSDEGALDLDGFFGLHPRLAPLMPAWRDGYLAVVHACGSPDSTRSHFEAQDDMESGTPGVKATGDGWVNRAVRAMDHAAERDARSRFRAVAVTPMLPRALQGRAPAVALGRWDACALHASRIESTLGAGEALAAIRRLRKADPARYEPHHGAAYPRTAFGEEMRQVAQLARADVGLEIAFVEIGQWDHHVAAGGATGQFAARLADFGSGIAAFTRDLGDRMTDTVIVSMSEFGRTVAENSARGTDHGHGNVMLVLGGGVRGGRVHGTWPGLDREQLHDGRDLAVTTDFRTVIGEVIAMHLGIRDVGAVFPGFEGPIRLGVMV